MTDKIIAALKLEAKALVANTGKFQGEFVMATDYKDTGEVTYSFPLVMLYMSAAHDSEPFCGGAMKVNWNFSFAVYYYDPNSYVDDESGYSEQLALPLDIVRAHFGGTNRLWLTPGMAALQQNYGTRFTWDGITPAPRLKHADGLAMGFAHLFASVSVDTLTDSVQESTATLQTVITPAPTL